MEYQEEWHECHLTKEETTLFCSKCGKPTNINVLVKIKVQKTEDEFEVFYICKKCDERDDINGETKTA